MNLSAQKQILAFAMLFSLENAMASVRETIPVISEIIKKTPLSEKYCPSVTYGEICLMTWYEAIAFCKSENAHLPTAREYANWIRPRGAKILEMEEVKETPPEGFYLVRSRNPDGTFDSFYLNHSAYVRPIEEVGNHLLWTSSIPPEHPQYAHVFYDQWGGGGGDPKDHLLDHRNAVQCVLP